MLPWVVFDETFLAHQQHPHHPESPQRLSSIRARLIELGMWDPLAVDRPAPLTALAAVHSKGYLEMLAAAIPGPLDGDTYLHAQTFVHAKLAAGGALETLARARVDRPAIGLLRPPGHHARPREAMGFCYLNNVAIAAAAARTKGRRVAIVDLDLHHGNGTQEIFYEDPSVLFLSTHEEGNYPGTGAIEEIGAGAGEGTTLNVPLPSGSGDGTFGAAMQQVILPALETFCPTTVLISLGTDAHARDPLGRLELSSRGLVSLVAAIAELCQRRLEAPLVVLLEGGYDLQAGADCIGGIVGTLAGEAVPLRFATPTDPQMVGARWVAAARARLPQHQKTLLSHPGA